MSPKQFNGKLLLFFGLILVLSQVMGYRVIAQEDLDVTAVVAGAPAPGGGGSSSGSQTNATVVISGFSFPSAKLTLLKDGAVSTTLFANPDGTFQITINNLNFGNYQLSVYAEDPTGNISSPHTLNVAAFGTQPYVYSGIVLPPTLSVNPNLIQIRSSFKATGYSAPNSLVSVFTSDGQNLGSATAGSNGYYEVIAPGTLPAGVHSLRAQATLNGINSFYSRPVQILIYTGPTPPPGIPIPPAHLGLCVDYNKDRRVNLIDFSILLFWFGKTSPPDTIDCNDDGLIDLKDFSILMYFWTG